MSHADSRSQEVSSTPKVRVLLAIGSLGGGGSERQIVGILKYLDRSRFEPFLYVIYREGELLAEVPADVPIFAFWDRHAVPRYYFPGRIHRMQTRDLCTILREQHIDVLYDRTYHMTLIAAPASRRAGVRRLSVVASDPHLELDAAKEHFVGIKRQLLRKAYLQADKTITVSEALQTRVSTYYKLPADQVQSLDNFLDLDRIRHLSAQEAPAWEVGRFHIVTAGRLHPQKGYIYLLRALEQLIHHRHQHELCLHILGSGPLETQLKACVAQMQLEGHVRFEGFVPNPFPMIRQAELFCLPSLYEGMPNALMEAMYCGVPILATDCPTGPREILADGDFGDLVMPADSRALADAIADAMINRERWQSRAARAKASAENRWSPRVAIARLEATLLSVC